MRRFTGQAIYEPWTKRVVPLMKPSLMRTVDSAAADDTNDASFINRRQTISFNEPDSAS